MFPIFLFAVIFSFLSWLQYNPQCYECSAPISSVIVADAVPLRAAATELEVPIIAALTSITPTIPGPDPVLTDPEEATAQQYFLAETTPASVTRSLEEMLQGVDLDTLQLRPARKIAKALSIAQKINKQDQPLSFLRAQIKAKLQQSGELPPEAIDAIRELLAS